MREKELAGFSGTAGYITSKSLRDVVNASIALKRPLLVKGEPGTGKTLLSHAIAEGLGKKILVWNIKSTTKARDGLYVYDAVQRLYDSRFQDKDVSDIKQYIRLGRLGESFVADEQVVILIDEVDKADMEFPNDLLNELDEMSFYIHETGETIKAKHRPIVIITSNNEKELPDAFLRRCLFHFIQFPDEEMLKKIALVHYPNLNEKLLREALARFMWIREMEELRKKPSTSELLDWIQALVAGGVSPAEIQREIPFLGALIKKEQDFAAVEARTSRR